MVNPPPCTLSSHDYRPLCLRRAFSIGWKQQFFSAGGRLEEKERPYLWGSTILSLNTTIVVPLASQFYCEQRTEQLPLYLRLSWTVCPSVSLCLSVSVSESLCLCVSLSHGSSWFILLYLEAGCVLRLFCFTETLIRWDDCIEDDGDRSVGSENTPGNSKYIWVISSSFALLIVLLHIV